MRSIEGQTLVLVGLGGIGAEVARKAKSFDMRVVAVTRSAVPTSDIDEAIPRERMCEALRDADAVVVATASDPSSFHLIDSDAFGAMKDTAYFINIARGEIVDEDALISALRAGQIAGAALDVTEDEPLDPESPLWDMENVIITPHVSAAGSANDYFRLRALFAENLNRFRSRRPLDNLYHFDDGRALPATN
jgi:phosphoglycerate dehydrogenase-like enzyme